jgi:pantoate--beta-alanine ligase
MEGKFRPGHFDGVGTIVKRLFEIVTLQMLILRKDFQQLQMKKMVRKITEGQCNWMRHFRESNGLAMSSRNERLTDQAKRDASLILQL